jgi:glycosyltransferase involved in cell wall biosynthesis
MRIAINTRFLLSHKMEGFGWYTYETTKRLVENHPEHTFILFFDRPFDSKFVFGPNVIPVVLRPPARHPILFIIWFEWAVFRALKKYKATVFFSPDGYLSLRSKIPQISVIHDLNFEHFPQDIPAVPRTYLRYFFPKFAKKASKIVTVSHYSKADIAQMYGIQPSKIDVGWNGVSDVFKPISESQKIAVRNQYAEGKSYFLFVGAIHPRKNVKRLMQAFEMYVNKGGEKQLVIVGESLWGKGSIDDELIQPKTKRQIHFTGHLPLNELANVMASAFCFTYVPYFEGFGIPLVEAMRSGVPIIAGKLTSLPEVGGEAALYVNPFDVASIARAMLLIESDETMRQQLIALGLERSLKFDWSHTADVCWKAIQEVAST